MLKYGDADRTCWDRQLLVNANQFHRLPRICYNSTVGLSSVVLVALIVLWVRSYHGGDRVNFRRDTAAWEGVSRAGEVNVDNALQRELEDSAWQRNVNRGRAELTHASRELDKELALALGLTHDIWAALDQEDSYIKALASYNRAKREYDATLAAPHPTAIPHEFSLRLVFPAVGAALLPLIWLSITIHDRLRRWRRVASGQCLVCGYNLHATYSRCSECGKIFEHLNVWYQGEFIGHAGGLRLRNHLWTYPFTLARSAIGAAFRAKLVDGRPVAVEIVLEHGPQRMFAIAMKKKTLTLAPNSHRTTHAA